MNLIEAITTRRSVREYLNKDIDSHVLEQILRAALWTPSGKNGQPWRFKIVTGKEKEAISKLSVYGSWMKNAACFVVVFLDKSHSYHYIKDVQSCGAFIQNIMLAAHSLNIGSCWIGEILSQSKNVNKLLGIADNMELMGIVTLGYYDVKSITTRKAFEEFELR